MTLNESNLLIDGVITTWSGQRQWPAFMHHALTYESNHQGAAKGEFAVKQLFEDNFPGSMTVNVNTSTHVVRTNDDRGIHAAYFYGNTTDSRLQNNNSASFGGIIVLNTVAGNVEHIRVHINWLKGNKNIVHHWHFPYERQWQPGDHVSPLISETDAPWHMPSSQPTLMSQEDEIVDAWLRYAWALDMADYGLFNDAFTKDARADLPPMGKLTGRRTLIATLKAFRMPWPWIQHYGVPLNIDIASGGDAATLLIGRIIPEQDKTPEGEPLYGAHYKIELRKEDNKWKMSRMDYFPGWFTVKSDA